MDKRKAKKRRKRLEKKRRAAQYQPWPRYLLYRHEVGDVPIRSQSNLSPLSAISAYQQLRNGSTLPFSVEAHGPSGNCYANVMERISVAGGRLVLGWQLCMVPRVTSCRNRLATKLLVAHAIWQKSDGELCDVTQSPRLTKGLAFIPDEKMIHPSAQSVSFVDNLAAAESLLVCYLRSYRSFLIEASTGRVTNLGVQQPRTMR